MKRQADKQTRHRLYREMFKQNSLDQITWPADDGQTSVTKKDILAAVVTY